MHLINLGLIDYREALERQHRIHEKVVAGELPAALIVCRHRPVITVGRAAKAAGLLLPETEYANRGIEVIKVDRGGDITYHGPGQITAYPIYPLSAFAYDLHAYLRFLEDSVISMLGEIGIISSRLRGLRGVWVSNRKIASIGIAVKKWVSYHGISLILRRSEMENFGLIRPCGLNISMTSIEEEFNGEFDRDVTADEITCRLIRRLSYDECRCAAAW